VILADKRDYLCGYRKHYSAYKSLHNAKDAIISKRLLLAYSVECGLKYLLIDKWKITNLKLLLINNEDSRSKIIKSHNLEKILKELGQTGTFKFPQILTKHKDNITSENFHQLCRYGIKVVEKDKCKEENYEEELKKIANWIAEGI